MISRKYNLNGVKTKGGSVSTFDVSYSPQINIIAQAGSSQLTTQDEVRLQVTGATLDNEAVVADTILLNTPKVVTNLTPEIAAHNPITGRLTRISNGTASILFKTGTLTKRVDVPITRTVGQTTTTHSSFVSGSLARHITDNVDSRIGILTASSSTLNVFSTVDHITPTYIRNSNLWCSDFASALTGISPWNSNGGQQQGGTLITPRHIAYANHFQIPIGATIRFVTVGGVILTRTLIASSKVFDSDIQIALLDSDLPSTITPLSILPTNWANYIKNLGSGIPVINRNQFGEIRIVNSQWMSANTTIHSDILPVGRISWYRDAIPGDSGSPQAFIINGKLVLLSTWATALSGSSFYSRNWSSEISALDALAGVSTGYTPSVIDLSTFPTY